MVLANLFQQSFEGAQMLLLLRHHGVDGVGKAVGLAFLSSWIPERRPGPSDAIADRERLAPDVFGFAADETLPVRYRRAEGTH